MKGKEDLQPGERHCVDCGFRKAKWVCLQCKVRSPAPSGSLYNVCGGHGLLGCRKEGYRFIPACCLLDTALSSIVPFANRGCFC